MSSSVPSAIGQMNFSPHSTVVDIHGIVGSASSWGCYIRDDAWETNRACIHTILLLVVVAEHLSGYLRDTVDGLRALDGILRRTPMGGVLAKRADAAGGENGTVVLSGYLQDIPQSVDANLPC